MCILPYITFILSHEPAFFLTNTYNECDPIIKQKLTGERIQNEPQWKVFIEVNSDCYCTYMDVKLACHGFKTVEPLDSSVITRNSKDVCSVINDIHPDGGEATFTYAWPQSFNFKTIFFQIGCS